MSIDIKNVPAQWRSSPPFYHHLGFRLDALADGELTGRGTVVKRGRSVMFAEAEVSDAGGTQVCRATATFRVKS